jgi:hypothetical protein
LDSNRALHEYLAMDLSYNKKVMRGCGLSRIPSRRTFDRRLATISNDIKNRITTMGELFVRDKIVDPCVLSADSTLIKAKGYVWHKSSMEEGVVPRSGIDTDAMWGFSHTKGWMDIWIQITFDIKYWFHYSAIGSRFYNCKYTRQSDVQYIDSKFTSYNNQKNIIHVCRPWI